MGRRVTFLVRLFYYEDFEDVFTLPLAPLVFWPAQLSSGLSSGNLVGSNHERLILLEPAALQGNAWMVTGPTLHGLKYSRTLGLYAERGQGEPEPLLQPNSTPPTGEGSEKNK